MCSPWTKQCSISVPELVSIYPAVAVYANTQSANDRWSNEVRFISAMTRDMVPGACGYLRFVVSRRGQHRRRDSAMVIVSGVVFGASGVRIGSPVGMSMLLEHTFTLDIISFDWITESMRWSRSPARDSPSGLSIRVTRQPWAFELGGHHAPHCRDGAAKYDGHWRICGAQGTVRRGMVHG